MVSLSNQQMETLKSMVEFGQAFSEQILNIMHNSKLDEIEGTRLVIEVNPKCKLTTRLIKFGYTEESGHIEMCKGYRDGEWVVTGRNSAEYEVLFGKPETVRRIKEMLQAEKPLPPDGLWISRYDDPPVLDDRRDVNAEADQCE